MRGGGRVPDGKRRHRGPHIYRRGRVWWLYVDHDVRVSLETRDEDEARARMPDRLREAVAPRAVGDAPDAEVPLDDVADRYVEAHAWTRATKRTYKARVLAFVEAMGELGVTRASRITDTILTAWRDARMREVGRATIVRDETTAERMLRWAALHRPPLIPANPMAGHKTVRAPRRAPPPLIPSPAEIRRVIAAMVAQGERGAALAVATALATGQRIDELRHLRPEQIHGDALHVVPEAGPAATAWTGKSHRERAIPLHKASVATVRAFAEWITAGKGGKGKRPGLASTWIGGKIDAARTVCKPEVPVFRMHDLRRTFATENVRAGVPLTVVRDWLGQRDVATTERYLGRYRSDAARPSATSVALALPVRTVVRKRGVRRPKRESLEDS